MPPLAELPIIEEKVRNAEAELQRIERCIAADDPQLQAKSGAAVRVGGDMRAARTAHVMARLEAGDYGIKMNRL